MGEDLDCARLAIRRFLHADSAGCEFVGHFARQGEGIWWATAQGVPGAAVLSEQVEQAEKEQEAAGIVLPDIASEAQLVALVDQLGTSQRWLVEREHATRDGVNVVVVRVFWINSTNEKCSVLGMAPMLTMPATRRTPYVSMFVWPGPRRNNHRQKAFPEIGIGDMQPPQMERGAYTALRRKTESRVLQLNAGYRPGDATFILPA